jgi:arginase
MDEPARTLRLVWPQWRIVADVSAAAEVVGFTIAEFIPRQVMHLQQVVAGFPLLAAGA